MAAVQTVMLRIPAAPLIPQRMRGRRTKQRMAMRQTMPRERTLRVAQPSLREESCRRAAMLATGKQHATCASLGNAAARIATPLANQCQANPRRLAAACAVNE